MKRIVSLCLSLVLLVVLLPMPRAQAAIASWEYQEKVQAFIADSHWDHGSSWDRNMQPLLSQWRSLGCCAYAADFTAYVYGVSNAWHASSFTAYSDPSEIRAGDIVHFKYSNPSRTSEHWIVVLDRDGDKLYTAEGNAYVDGQLSRVLISKDKWILKNGQLVNSQNTSEKIFDYDCYHYKFSDGGTGSMDSSVCYHKKQETLDQKNASCGVEGYTGDTICASCGLLLEAGEPIPMLTHKWSGNTCVNCGGLASDVYRLGGETRFDTALNVANELKQTLGVEKFDYIIIASGMGFADALAGSYLAATLQAPILLSYVGGPINEKVAAYVRENLSQDGLVYVLGGESAVPASFVEELTGCNVRRLAGADRFETNLEILMEAGVGSGPILVCTGGNFADSLSASASGLPILLVWQELTAQQKAFLESVSGSQLYVIGGEAAVNQALEAQLKDYGQVERLAGDSRFETSVKIAEKFFSGADAAVLAYAWNYPDGLCGGALAAAMGAPLILTMDGRTDAAEGFVKGMTQGYVLGSASLISDEAAKTVFDMSDSLAIREK